MYLNPHLELNTEKAGRQREQQTFIIDPFEGDGLPSVQAAHLPDLLTQLLVRHGRIQIRDQNVPADTPDGSGAILP